MPPRPPDTEPQPAALRFLWAAAALALCLPSQNGLTADPTPFRTGNEIRPRHVPLEDRQKIRLSRAQLIENLLANNPELELERKNVAIAQSEVMSAKGIFDPLLNISVNRNYRERLANFYTAQTARFSGEFATAFTAAKSPDDLEARLAAVGEPNGAKPLEYFEDSINSGVTLAQKTPTGGEIRVTLSTISAENTFNSLRSENGIPYSPFSPRQIDALAFARLSQPLLKNAGPSNTLIRLRLAKTSKKVADARFRSEVNQRASEAIRAYLQLGAALRAVEIERKGVQAAESLLSDTQKQFAAGKVDSTETGRVQSILFARKDRLAIAEQKALENQVQLRRLIIKNAAQFDDPALWEPTEIFIPEPASSQDASQPLSALLAIAKKSRPEFEAVKELETKETQRFDYAKNQLKPDLNLVAGYGYRGTSTSVSTSWDLLSGLNRHEWVAGLEFSFPLGNREAKGNVARARASVDQTRVAAQRIEADVAKEIVLALDALRTAQTRIENSRKALSEASETLRAEEAKFAEGRTTAYFVLEAQTTQNIAALQEVAARQAREQARIDLQTATGTLLDQLGIEWIQPDAAPKKR